MRDRTYRWAPGVLIGAAYVLSAVVYARLDATVTVDLRALLPVDLGTTPERLPRAVAAFGLPTLAVALWALLHDAPVSPLGRFTSRLFGRSERPRYEAFASTYRLITTCVVAIVLAFHVAMLASILSWSLEAGRIVGLIFGVALMIIGNVMPRLRQNPVAGIRTQHTMSDPRAWARAHRAFGAMWLAAGLLTTIAALAAPRYALITGVSALALVSISGLLIPRGLTLGRPRREAQ
jgi:uncharacterized membrane protein